MSVIVYHKRSGIIATDGRSTMGSYIANDDTEKYFKHEGKHFFFCGSPSHKESFLNIHFGINIDSPYIIDKPDFYALVYDNGVVYNYSTPNGVPSKDAIDCDISIGSGEDFAIAAIDLGFSAEVAVKAAIKRDSGCGGTIRFYKLEDLK